MEDSGDEMFITQTAPEYQMLEHEVDYDCSYLNSQYEENWSIPVGEVEYWDFTNQPDNSSVAPSLPIVNDYTGNSEPEPAFQPLIGEEYFGDDEDVS